MSFLVGDATALPPLQVDLATMTGTVAQVFLTDDDWMAAPSGSHGVLRPGGLRVDSFAGGFRVDAPASLLVCPATDPAPTTSASSAR